MKDIVEKSIINWFGVDYIGEVIDNHMAELNDSVVPGFCKHCGEYYGDVEPDACGYLCTKCGKREVASIVEILVF